MFSLELLYRYFRLTTKFPIIIPNILRFDRLPQVIHSARMNAWTKEGSGYINKPKRAFGFDIWLNPKDMAISSAIAAIGWYQPSFTELFRKIVKRGMVVVDIGANIGYYTCMAASMVGEQGLVLAFEPEPTNFRFLTKSVNTNDFRNVETFQMAISDVDSSAYLWLSNENTGEHSLVHKEKTAFREHLSVKCSTLDKLASTRKLERLDVLKIDVEGAEPAVLQGGLDSIAKFKPKIFLEFNADRWTDQIHLLNHIYDNYQINRITYSPFLVKKVDKSYLVEGHFYGNLFLTPLDTK